jgi:hypothetical protein
MTRIKAEFTVADNPDKRFTNEDIKLTMRNDTHVSRVWVMSYSDLEELQTSIRTFLADG